MKRVTTQPIMEMETETKKEKYPDSNDSSVSVISSMSSTEQCQQIICCCQQMCLTQNEKNDADLTKSMDQIRAMLNVVSKSKCWTSINPCLRVRVSAAMRSMMHIYWDSGLHGCADWMHQCAVALVHLQNTVHDLDRLFLYYLECVRWSVKGKYRLLSVLVVHCSMHIICESEVMSSICEQLYKCQHFAHTASVTQKFIVNLCLRLEGQVAEVCQSVIELLVKCLSSAHSICRGTSQRHWAPLLCKRCPLVMGALLKHTLHLYNTTRVGSEDDRASALPLALYNNAMHCLDDGSALDHANADQVLWTECERVQVVVVLLLHLLPTRVQPPTHSTQAIWLDALRSRIACVRVQALYVLIQSFTKATNNKKTASSDSNLAELNRIWHVFSDNSVIDQSPLRQEIMRLFETFVPLVANRFDWSEVADGMLVVLNAVPKQANYQRINAVLGMLKCTLQATPDPKLFLSVHPKLQSCAVMFLSDVCSVDGGSDTRHTAMALIVLYCCNHVQTDCLYDRALSLLYTHNEHNTHIATDLFSLLHQCSVNSCVPCRTCDPKWLPTAVHRVETLCADFYANAIHNVPHGLLKLINWRLNEAKNEPSDCNCAFSDVIHDCEQLQVLFEACVQLLECCLRLMQDTTQDVSSSASSQSSVRTMGAVFALMMAHSGHSDCEHADRQSALHQFWLCLCLCVKTGSELLVTLCAWLPAQANTERSWHLLIRLLTTFTHKGIVDAAECALARLCRLPCLPRTAPQHTLFMMLSEFTASNTTTVTEQSAVVLTNGRCLALTAILRHILTSQPTQHMVADLHRVMSALSESAIQHTHTLSTSSNGRIAPLLQCLAVLVTNSQFGKHCSKYLCDLLQVAVSCQCSNNWTVRSAATQLLSGVCYAIFGRTEVSSLCSAGVHSVSAMQCLYTNVWTYCVQQCTVPAYSIPTYSIPRIYAVLCVLNHVTVLHPHEHTDRDVVLIRAYCLRLCLSSVSCRVRLLCAQVLYSLSHHSQHKQMLHVLRRWSLTHTQSMSTNQSHALTTLTTLFRGHHPLFNYRLSKSVRALVRVQHHEHSSTCSCTSSAMAQSQCLSVQCSWLPVSVLCPTQLAMVQKFTWSVLCPRKRLSAALTLAGLWLKLALNNHKHELIDAEQMARLLYCSLVLMMDMDSDVREAIALSPFQPSSDQKSVSAFKPDEVYRPSTNIGCLLPFVQVLIAQHPNIPLLLLHIHHKSVHKIEFNEYAEVAVLNDFLLKLQSTDG